MLVGSTEFVVFGALLMLSSVSWVSDAGNGEGEDCHIVVPAETQEDPECLKRKFGEMCNAPTLTNESTIPQNTSTTVTATPPLSNRTSVTTVHVNTTMSVTTAHANTTTSVTTAHANTTTSVTTARANTTTSDLKPTSKGTHSSTTKSVPSSKPASTRVVATTTTTNLFINVTSTSSKDTHTGSRFDAGSFIGGILLTLSLVALAYLSCKCIRAQRGVRYTSIEEHDAII